MSQNNNLIIHFDSPSVKRRIYYRTKLCRHGQNCSDPNCSYAHSESEILKPLCVWGSECQHYKQGCCKYRHEVPPSNEIITTDHPPQINEHNFPALPSSTDTMSLTLQIPTVLFSQFFDLTRSFIRDHSIVFTMK